MRITVSQLRRIIKEEVQRVINESTENVSYRKSDPEWLDLKNLLGMKEYSRRFIRAEKVRDSGWRWMPGWAPAQYKKLSPTIPQVIDSYNAMVEALATSGEDSQEFEDAVADNDAALQQFDSAFEAWQDAYDAKKAAEHSERAERARNRSSRDDDLLPAEAGGPLYQEVIPTASEREAAAWGGHTGHYTRQRRHPTAAERDSAAWGGYSI